MKKYDFNQDWFCKSLTHGGEAYPVTLPHDAMRTENRTSTSMGEANIGWFEGGDYAYIKTFTLPEVLRGQTLVLEFESVYHNAEVYINDREATHRPYGYTNFYVEMNPYIWWDRPNTLRVVARNADQPNSRWYSGTGIYRPVWLYAGGPAHIPVNGLRVCTVDHNAARIHAEVRTSQPGPVHLEVLDGARVVCTAHVQAQAGAPVQFDLSIPDCKLWSVDTPHLYTARAHFGNDVAEETFGVRTLAWDPQQGLTLNGERVILRGACIHHDNGLLGACTYPEVEQRRVRILKEAGYNTLRSAHNPASKYLLDACDRLGMLMIDEYVDCWYIHKTEHDYAPYVEQWWQKDLTDMVDKDYNHPCVVMYSTGNEVAETAQERGIRLQQSFTDYLHKLDPTRPVTCGINIFFNFLSSAGFGVYSDEKAQKQAQAAARAAQDARKKKPRKKPVGSEFYNRMAALLGCDFMKLGAILPPCDWRTRDAFAAMDIAGYNYGILRYERDCKRYPNRLIVGSETFIGDTYRFWEMAKTHPQVIGDMVWAGWDYIGECGDDGVEFASYKTGRPEDHIRGGTCRIDATGKKTPEVDYTRVAFELETGPFLAVFPVCEKTKPRITGWQLTRALRSWSYPGCDGKETEVEIYARAYEVELQINGKCVGRKRLKNTCRAVFKTTYHDGKIIAIAYDANGAELGRDVLHTAGQTTQLRLEPECVRCKPGEMLYLRVRYTDETGEIKPLERHRVTFTAENGTVMGTANGSTYFAGNYTQPSVSTYFGEAQAVVQAGAAGTVCITVRDGERAATVEIACEAE